MSTEIPLQHYPPKYLLELLLGAQLVGVAALLLAAVHGTRRQACVALAAHVLLDVVLASKGSKSGLNDTTAKAQHKVQRGLLLDVVVSQGSAILQLLAGEDEALLIRGDALLVLDLLLNALDGVRRLHLEGDGLTREGLRNRERNTPEIQGIHNVPA